MAFLGGLPSRSYKSHQAVTGYMSALYTLLHPHTWAFLYCVKFVGSAEAEWALGKHSCLLVGLPRGDPGGINR